MTSSKKPFLYHVEFMRAAAIILVVFSHVPDMGNQGNRQLFNSIFLNSTVLFLFISGYLFTFLNRSLDYPGYLGKKLGHVFLPYLILSALIMGFRILVTRDLALSKPADILLYLVNGSYISGPFWYIPVVMIFFLAAPLLLWICSRPRVARVAVPFLVLVSCFSFRSESVPLTLGEAVTANLVFALHFCGIYCLGGVVGLNRERFDPVVRESWFLAAMAAVYALSFILYWENYPAQVSTSFEDVLQGRAFFPNYAQFRMLALAFFLYGLGLNCVKRRFRLVKLIAETSFGIYFTHYSIVKYLYPFLSGRLGDSLAVMVLSGFITLGASLALVTCLRRLLGRKSIHFIGC